MEWTQKIENNKTLRRNIINKIITNSFQISSNYYCPLFPKYIAIIFHKMSIFDVLCIGFAPVETHPIFSQLDEKEFSHLLTAFQNYEDMFSYEIKAYYKLTLQQRKQHEHVCAIGMVPIFSLLDDSYLTKDVIKNICMTSETDVIKYLWRNYDSFVEPVRVIMFDTICEIGDIELGKWMLDEQKKSKKEWVFTIEALNGACKNMKNDMIKWMHDNEVCKISRNTMCLIGTTGNTEIAKFLDEHYHFLIEDYYHGLVNATVCDNNLDFVTWICEKKICGDPYEHNAIRYAIYSACEHGCVKNFMFLHSHNEKIHGHKIDKKKVFTNVFLSKNIQFIMMLKTEQYDQIELATVFDNLVNTDCYDIIKFILDEKLHLINSDGKKYSIDNACTNGKLRCIELITSNMEIDCSSQSVINACNGSNVEIFEWLYLNKDKFGIQFKFSALLAAAVTGNSVYLVEKLLRENGIKHGGMFLRDAFLSASIKGNLEMIKLLHKLGVDNGLLSQDLLKNKQLTNLYMHIPQNIKRIHGGDTYEDTDDDTNNIVSNTKEIVNTIDNTREIINMLNKENNLKKLRMCPTIGLKALMLACKYGHLKLIQWIKENMPDCFLSPWDDDESEWCWKRIAMTVACGFGQMEIVNWLTDINGAQWCTQRALKHACKNNAIRTVEWMFFNTNLFDLAYTMTGGRILNRHLIAISAACKTGNLNLVKRLIETYTPSHNPFTNMFATDAIFGNQIHVLKYICNELLCKPTGEDKMKKHKIYLYDYIDPVNYFETVISNNDHHTVMCPYVYEYALLQNFDLR